MWTLTRGWWSRKAHGVFEMGRDCLLGRANALSQYHTYFLGTCKTFGLMWKKGQGSTNMYHPHRTVTINSKFHGKKCENTLPQVKLTNRSTSASSGLNRSRAKKKKMWIACALIYKKKEHEDTSSYKIMAQNARGTKISVDDRKHSVPSGSSSLHTHIIKLKTKDWGTLRHRKDVSFLKTTSAHLLRILYYYSSVCVTFYILLKRNFNALAIKTCGFRVKKRVKP